MESAGFWEILRESITASFYISLFGIPFALLPVGAYALALKAQGSKWMIPATDSKPERKVRFLPLAILGGLGGDSAAVCSMFIGEWWICRTQHQLCNDGQGGLIFVITVPAFAILGSLVALGWTWLTLGVSAHLPWASVFRYCGSYRGVNWAQAILVPLIFWTLVAYGLAWAMLRF